MTTTKARVADITRGVTPSESSRSRRGGSREMPTPRIELGHAWGAEAVVVSIRGGAGEFRQVWRGFRGKRQLLARRVYRGLRAGGIAVRLGIGGCSIGLRECCVLEFVVDQRGRGGE